MKVIYLKIPETYKQVYDALVERMEQYGTDLLNDCSTDCKGSTKNLISCWNMFQSACCSCTKGNYKKSDLLINYINTKLKLGLPKVETTDDVKYTDIQIEPVFNVTSSGIHGVNHKVILNYGFDTVEVSDSDYVEIYYVNPIYQSNVLKAVDYTSHLQANVRTGIYINKQTRELVEQYGTNTYYNIRNNGTKAAGVGFNITVQNTTYTVYIDIIGTTPVLKVVNSNLYVIYTGDRYLTTTSQTYAMSYTPVTKDVNNQGNSSLRSITNGILNGYAKLVKHNEQYLIGIYDGNREFQGWLSSINVANFFTINEFTGDIFSNNVNENDAETIEIPFTLSNDEIIHLQFRVDANWLDVKDNWLSDESKNIIITRLEQNTDYVSRTAKLDILHEGDLIKTITIVQESNENNDWI